MSKTVHTKSRRELERLLQASGLPYELANGTKHLAVRLAGRQVAVLQHGSKEKPYPYLKRIAKAIREAQDRLR